MKDKLAVLIETVKRFPAASILALANVGFVCQMVSAKEGAEYLYASGLSIVFSAFVELVTERLGLLRRKGLFLQGGVIVVFALLVFAFCGYEMFEEHFCYSYYLTLFGFGALTAWALGWVQKSESVFPALSFAGMIGVAAAVGVGGGLSLVMVAIDKLFGCRIEDSTYATIWGASFAALGVQFFLAYATRREPFEFPKVWKVLLAYVGLPTYLLLLGVLWTYLAKCVVTWNLPNGQINWLVTTASVLWMIFHLMLAGLDGRPIRLFRRWGALLILPLIVLQICALQIRIAAYGLTPSRYASVLFVVFVILFALVVLIRRRVADRMLYLIFAVLALFAAHSRWNIVDTGVRAQEARLRAFVARRLAGEKFSQPDQFVIMSTWEFLRPYVSTNGCYRKTGQVTESLIKEFNREWGFAHLNAWERRNKVERKDPSETCHFVWGESNQVDVCGFRLARKFKLQNEKNKLILTDRYVDSRTRRTRIDVTAALLDAFAKVRQDAARASDSSGGESVSHRSLELGSFDLADGRRAVMLSGCVELKFPGTDRQVVSYAWGDCVLLEK